MLYLCTTYDSEDPFSHDTFIIESELSSAKEVARELPEIIFADRELDNPKYKNKLNNPYILLYICEDDGDDNYVLNDIFQKGHWDFCEEDYTEEYHRFIEIKKVDLTIKV